MNSPVKEQVVTSLLDSIQELLDSPDLPVKVLRKALQSPNERPRPRPWSQLPLLEEEAAGISSLFPKVARAAHPLIQSEDNELRYEAIQLLGLVPCGEVRELLIPVLQDPSSICRVEAVDGLAACPPSTASITAVIALLDDPKAPVRLHAAAALGQMGATASIGPLRSALQNPQETSGVKQWAAHALAELGEATEPDLAPSDPLTEAEEDESIQREAAERVAEGLAAMLGAFKKKDSVTMGDFAAGLEALERQFGESGDEADFEFEFDFGEGDGT